MLKHADLFCGMGGFAEGLKRYCKTVWAADNNRDAADIFEANHGVNAYRDLRNGLMGRYPDEIDVLTGGFPCQPFSTALHEPDPRYERKKLYEVVFGFVEWYSPKIIILENVPQFRKADDGKYHDAIMSRLRGFNYRVVSIILNAADCRVPQVRKRLFIVASKWSLPNLTAMPKRTRGSVCDFMETVSGEKPLTKGVTYFKSKYPRGEPPNRRTDTVPVGYFGKNRQGEKVYSSKGYAITQMATGQTGWYSYVDDDGKLQYRKLNTFESKRIMGFPSEYIIPEEVTKASKMIGNAVCPGVVERIMDAIAEKHHNKIYRLKI